MVLKHQKALAIKGALKITISIRKMMQTLKKHTYTEYIKHLESFALADDHKNAECNGSRKNHTRQKSDRTSVVYSDERKFSLDGPDDIKCY